MIARFLDAIRGYALLLALVGAVSAEVSRQQVEELFAKSTKVAPSVLDAARAHYDSLLESGASGLLLDYAFALVLVEQRQFQEASALLEKLVKNSPSAMPPRKTLVWLQLARKEHEKALLGLEAIAANLAAGKNAKLTTDQREAARFLGSAIAFLEVPATSTKIEKLVAVSKGRLLKNLNPQLRPDFDEGHAATVAQFEKIRGETDAAKDEVAKQQAAAIAAQSEQLESEKAAIDSAKEELEKKAAERKQETQAEIDAINEQVSELQEDFNRVMAAGAPVQAQISAAQAEIAALTQLVTQPDGSQVIEYRDPQRVRFLEQLIAQLQIQLAPLQAELNAINFRANELRNKYGKKLRQHNAELQKMMGEGQQLAKTETKIGRMEKQHAKAKATGNSTKTRTLAAKLSTFSTYEPFPLAAEKSRVLDLLK